ncbi:MAG: hypothetical protein AAF591_08480 [Verrucomicrobiota bacterium]
MKKHFAFRSLSIILLGTSIANLATSCDKATDSTGLTQSDYEQIYQEDRTKLEAQIADLTAENEALAETMAALESDLENTRNELAKTPEAPDLGDELEQTKADLAEALLQYRSLLWETASGADLGALTTASGKQYEGASIKRVSEAGLEIAHSAGFATIPPDDLPDELQDKYRFTNNPIRSSGNLAASPPPPAPPTQMPPSSGSTAEKTDDAPPSDEEIKQAQLAAKQKELEDAETKHTTATQMIVKAEATIDAMVDEIERLNSKTVKRSEAEMSKRYQTLQNAKTKLELMRKEEINLRRKARDLKNEVYRLKYY